MATIHLTDDDNERRIPGTVRLPDGRVIDIFPDGVVQVYPADFACGVEIQLPGANDVGYDVNSIPVERIS